MPKMKRVGARIRLVGLVVAAGLLLSGCRMEGHVSQLPDGRWRQETTCTLTAEELWAWGGESTLDPYFAQMEQSATMTGSTCQWWKEPAGDGIRYTIVIEGNQPSANLPMAGGEMDMWLESTLDGQWQAQETLTLSAADIAALGGESVLESSLNQGCQMFQSMQMTCQWWKESLPDGARYTLAFGGSGQGFSRFLPGLPTPRPLPSPQVLPTATPFSPPPTPWPSPPPQPTVPPIASPESEARSWLDKKARLIAALQSVDIPTDLFTVPGVRAYDETAAGELLARVEAQLRQGTLTAEQREALARLTIQEQALSQMLPAYTGIVAATTDAWADSIETTVGLLFALRPAGNACRQALPLCGRLMESTERALWRLLRNSGKLAFRLWGTEPDQREAGAKAWELMVRLAQDKLAQGHSLMDLLGESGIQAAGTALLIQPYLNRTQSLLDQGVRTADLEHAASDRWAITGSTGRAEALTQELVQKAIWQEDEALSRHQDFQRAANLAQVVEDIADLATLSPLAALAKAVSVGAHLEHLAVNLTDLYLNSKNASCVEYLATRAAEMAFDSDQPGDDCRYQGTGGRTDGRVPLAQRSEARTDPRQLALQGEADRYRQALQRLVQAVSSQDSPAVEQSIEQFRQAEEEMGRLLDEMEAILLEQATLEEGDWNLLGQSQDWTMGNLALYLSAAETLMARQSGVPPQTDLSHLAQEALVKVQGVEQAAAQVDLTPPSGKAVLVIRKVEIEGNAGPRLRLETEVSNVGRGTAAEVEITLSAGGRLLSPPLQLGTLLAGEERPATLEADWPTSSPLALQVWAQGVLMDTYLGDVPASSGGFLSAGRTGGPGISPALIILLIVGLVVLAGGGVLVATRARAARADQAGIQVVGGQGPPHIVPLRGPLTIGRDPRCEMVLADPAVSRHHARIARTPSGHYLLTDLGSSGGTFVNDRQVQQQILAPGDVIRLGNTRLVFHTGGQGKSRPAPSSPAAGPARGYVGTGSRWYAVPPQGAEIGRDPRCAIPLADPQASARHARLDWHGSTCMLTDLGSTNGTCVNGQRVTRCLLRPGDEIQVGRTRLRFL